MKSFYEDCAIVFDISHYLIHIMLNAEWCHRQSCKYQYIILHKRGHLDIYIKKQGLNTESLGTLVSSLAGTHQCI